MNKVAFGPASWIGLVGAIAAALAPVFGDIPGTTGAIIAAVLAGITVMGRQLQAVMNTAYGVGDVVDESLYVDEVPVDPTDAPV